MNTEWEALSRLINEGNIDAGVEEAVRLVESGHSPLQVFVEGIEPCLADVGDRFGRLEIFLPELMLAANVVKAIQKKLVPMMQDGRAEAGELSKGKVVLGTIFGDIHDIGKNIVAVMLEVKGFDVRDLGVGVPAAQLIDAAKSFEADIIGISGLMMPSLPYMRDAISLVKENEELVGRFKLIVGGGPVTREWALDAGADAYADNAVDAVEEALKLVGRAAAHA